MRVIFKNQFKIIWKKWFSFIGVFILLFLSVFLTSSSLSASENINNVFRSLNQSNMYQYRVGVNSITFNDKGYDKIKAHFFLDQSLSFEQQKAIYGNKVLPVLANETEIKQWNYNFQAWMIHETLKNNFSNYKVAVDYTIETIATINNNNYNISVQNGFNDHNWTAEQNKYNLKIANLVVIVEGHKAMTNDEVVIDISLKNHNNDDLKIGNKIEINGKQYQIVGRGYNFSSYLEKYSIGSNSDNLIVWLTNSEMNTFWNLPNYFNNRAATYYVNFHPQQIESFKKQLGQFYSYPPYTSDNWNDLKENTKLQLTRLETFIFTVFGVIVFIVSIIIIIIFLKKDVNRQSGSLGILIGLGVKRHNLALNMAFSYLTLLIVPIIFGFIASFGLQFYLTSLISKIIFFPFALVIFPFMPTIISLLIIPLILTIALSLIIIFLLNKSPLALINNYQKSKKIKTKIKKRLFLPKSIDYRLTTAFAKSNSKRIFSTLIIFFINFFLASFLLSFVNTYNYSMTFSSKEYTSHGNRLFSNDNYGTMIDGLFTAMVNQTDFNDQNGNNFYWVTKTDFIKNQGAKYQEITINNLGKITNFYNTYLSPETLKIIAKNPKIIEQYDQKLYHELLKLIPYWTLNNEYPYLTIGFKIYQSTNLPFVKLDGKWNQTITNGYNGFSMIGYQDLTFPQWIYYQGKNDQATLSELNQASNYYLNAVLPLQMVKQLNLPLGKIINCQITNGNVQDQPWAKIPIRLVGINNYNYFTSKVIVNQNLLFKFIIQQYQQINPTKKITIANDNNLINGMLVQDALPEINRNYSFCDYTKKYDNINYLQSMGQFQQYTAKNYRNSDIEDNKYIEMLVKGLETLIIIILIIAVIVILVLMYVIFTENKKNIISLKFLGYSNNKITALIISPYIIGFVLFANIALLIGYFALQFVLQIIFSATGIALIFHFSVILVLILTINTIILIMITYLLGIQQIKRSHFSDIMNEAY